MKEVNYLMTTLSTKPPDLSNLRIDNVNPCDTTLLHHHQPVRKLCVS